MGEQDRRVRLGFRGPSAFLIAYSVHLSRGGLVLPVGGAAQVGDAIDLELELPDDETLSDEARVLAVHPEANPPAISVGLNVGDELARLTDTLVARYTKEGSRLRVLIVARDGHTRQNLKRSVRATIASAQVGFAKDPEGAAPLLSNVPDLAVIDLDDDVEQVQSLWSICQSAKPPLPSILVASDPKMADELRNYGAWDVLVSPPSSAQFRRSVLRALARPLILEDSGPVVST